MAEPKIAENKPKNMTLKPGTYYWCSCGHSSNQPFCDGTHNKVEGGFAPEKFEITEEKEVWLCMCKHTKNKPFCDGSHNKL